MMLLIFFFSLAALFVWLISRPTRYLKQGKFSQAKNVRISDRTYYLEEVIFADYHQALHHYFQLLDDVQLLGNALEVKYDYLDWTNTILRFPNFTVQLVRAVNKVRLIKSENVMPIAEFERDLDNINVCW